MEVDAKTGPSELSVVGRDLMGYRRPEQDPGPIVQDKLIVGGKDQGEAQTSPFSDCTACTPFFFLPFARVPYPLFRCKYSTRLGCGEDIA